MLKISELDYIRVKVRNLYKTPQTANNPRPVNAIFINPSNTKEHEMAKANLCYDLAKEHKKFITEAVNKKTNERHDVVCLDDNKIYEICYKNNSDKVLERYKKQGYIVIDCKGE